MKYKVCAVIVTLSIFFGQSLSSAEAEYVWQQPEALPVQGVDMHCLGVDATGNAVVFWLQSAGDEFFFQSLSRPMSEKAWMSPEPIPMQPIPIIKPFLSNCDLGVDAFGNAYAAWTIRDNDNKYVVNASCKKVNEKWGLPTFLSGSKADNEFDVGVNLVVDPMGNGYALWSRIADEGHEKKIELATVTLDRIWSTSQNISSAESYPGGGGSERGAAKQGHIAVDSVGNVLATWVRHNGSHYVVQAAYKPYGQGWSAPEDISIENRQSWLWTSVLPGQYPKAAISPSGVAVVIWENEKNILYASVKDFKKDAKDKNDWSEPVLLAEHKDFSVEKKIAGTPALVVDREGNIHVLWLSTNLKMIAATKYKNQDWSHPVIVSDTIANQWAANRGYMIPMCALAVDERGSVLGVWNCYKDESAYIQVITKSQQEGSWSIPVNLATTNTMLHRPLIVTDTCGDAFVTWEEGESLSDSTIKCVIGQWR